MIAYKFTHKYGISSGILLFCELRYKVPQMHSIAGVCPQGTGCHDLEPTFNNRDKTLQFSY